MRDLTPNDPRKRFEWVIKTYWGKSYKGESLNAAVLDTFYVTTSLLGEHDLSAGPITIVSHEPGDLSARYATDDVRVERIQSRLEKEANQATAAKGAQAMLKRLGQPYEYNERNEIFWDGEQWGLADLVLQVVKLPETAPRDFLVPWIARELVALAKEVANGMTKSAPGGWSALRRDYHDAVRALYDKAPAIAQWAKETRTDIGKVDLATALEAISTYKFKESLVEQGPIVYTFKDGWTVQELRTERALTQEGDNMQNCVGGYAEDVDRGDTRIYSIRDVSGQPHVTMELRVPPGPSNYGSELPPEEFVRSGHRLRWHFEQILGKQNDRPIDEYRERAREFIDKVFDKEGLGWVIAGGTPKWGRFAGRPWHNLDFPQIFGTNHVGEDTLAGARFDDAEIDRCSFVGLIGPASFARAEISETNFQGANLRDVSFEGVKGYFVDFRSAVLIDASFDSAHLGGSDFRRTEMQGASFRDAHVDGAKFDGAQGGSSANWEGVELTTAQKEQLKLPLSAPEEASKAVLHLDWRSKRA